MAPAPGVDSSPDIQTSGQHLLDWYQSHRRDLPWRHTQDPYAIWVSEVMLQQTRVETVTAYYQRFLSLFPTLQSLAAASLDQVLKAWEGLGYYARARNLHASARRVAEELDGQLPRHPEALYRLPGVGRYTAAAVASIAFGQDAVALDGNLCRILCRLFSVDDDPGLRTTQRTLETQARSMLPPGRAGDFNQALMDLGATICLPKKPRCLPCPLANFCLARLEGIQDELPIRATRSHVPHRDVTAGVIRDGNGHVLITQRPLDGLLGGLWEFPGGKRRPREELAACLQREISEELDIEITVGELLCTVDHKLTHFHMTLYAFDCLWSRGTPQCLDCLALRWVTLDELDAFAFPAADRKVIAHLRGAP